jgi:hypothetical protein
VIGIGSGGAHARAGFTGTLLHAVLETQIRYQFVLTRAVRMICGLAFLPRRELARLAERAERMRSGGSR